jgi:hypothetical protein
VPRPTKITREQIVQFGVSLRGAAPLTLRRKYACISSFFGFLQDMGYAQGNPARRLPLPRVSEYVPVFLSEEMAQQLIAAACASRDAQRRPPRPPRSQDAQTREDDRHEPGKAAPGRDALYEGRKVGGPAKQMWSCSVAPRPEGDV